MVTGRYYGGGSAASGDATLRVDRAGMAQIDGEPPLRVAFSELVIKPRLGDSARYIHCPDGYVFETFDNDGVDALCRCWGTSGHNALHWLESRRRVVIAALVLLIVGGFLFVRYGIPALSLQITRLIPSHVDAIIAREYLVSLDQVFFKPSALADSERVLLREDFAQVLRETGHDYRLLFRDGGVIGANALALPDGTVIVTDQLVKRAQDPHLLRGILLHEIGHVYHRHAMQSLIRQSGIATIVLMLTGDVSTASSLVLLLPGALVQSQYSREFETQADAYALEQMLAQGLNPADFARVMQKLMGDDQTRAEADSMSDLLSYFSTHPPTTERIDRFMSRAATGDSR